MKNKIMKALLLGVGVFSASSSYSYLNIDSGQVNIAISILCDSFHPHYQSLGALAQAVQQSRMPISMSLHHQFTLLHLAAGTGWLEGVRFLLDRAAEEDAVDCSGRTPLHLAVVHGHCEIVQILVAHGASTALQTHAGHTPFFLASLLGHTEMIAFFARHALDSSTRPS